MSTAKITLIGFYNWLNAEDDDLFVNLSLPSGIDRDLVVNNILLKSGDFESLYGDPEFIQLAIGVWSDKWYRTFEKWYNALSIDYDPLYNYDRKEEWTTTDDGSRVKTVDQSGTSSDTGSGTSTDTVSAYNSSAFENDRQNTSSSSGSTSTSTDTSEDETMQNTNIRSGRAYGNIGVTTSQQMLQSELDLAEWNLYEHITDIFLSEFVIPVY